ncbi:MAG: ParB N-terminal domain-containing protein [Candidatus Azobacteroides sp.]|nr:ParB N-terminal domain-containing protein [Candidatus Azobacteroides sp.]
MLNAVDTEISKLSPADYNPRYLSPEAMTKLRESIRTLGIIKPVIVRSEDYKLLAGHQRTKVCAAMKMQTVPAFVLSGVNSSDEVRFNQLHNFCECEISERAPIIKIHSRLKQGFQTVKNSDIEIVSAGEKNQFVNELSKMILRYGQFANAVTDMQGNIIVSAVYAKAVKLSGMDLLVYAVPDELIEKAKYYFGKEYGQFEYSHIEKKTYIQSLAQKFRLRTNSKGEESKRSHSTLYEKTVIPNITKEMTVLDFGSGFRDYAKMLDKKGYKVHTMEFFLRKPGNDAIWTDEIRRDFLRIKRHLETKGQYDAVVCDSVLNSVNSTEDEKAVLICLSALCKPGGLIFYSGIPKDFKAGTTDRKNSIDPRGTGLFTDKNGFTANYRYGEWYFQKYHGKEDVKKLNELYIGTNYLIYDAGSLSVGELKKSSWQVKAINGKPNTPELAEWALDHEFSLPLPKGKHWDLNEDIIEAYNKSNILINIT